MLAVLGVRVPSSTLFLPPAVTPRCGHKFTSTVCPQCGIAADIASAASLATGFDGKTFHGYDVHRIDAANVVIGITARLATPVMFDAELLMGVYFHIKEKLRGVSLWTGDGFGMFCVEER
jgi:hypothetical protein